MALDNVVQLNATGVTAGTYPSANITVTADGRITNATAGSGGIPSGSVISFFQASAPTGWTQVTTQNNKAVRIVSGAGGTTGGSIPFTTLFSSSSTYTGSINITSGSVGSSTLTDAQLASHSHGGVITNGGTQSTGALARQNIGETLYPPGSTSASGGNQSHTHSLVGAQAGGNFTSNFAVQYIDMILASKD